MTGKGPKTTTMSLAHFGLDRTFDLVETGSPLGVVKAAAIARIVVAWGMTSREVIYVGDAVADMHAAAEAGVLAVAAAWRQARSRPSWRPRAPTGCSPTPANSRRGC